MSLRMSFSQGEDILSSSEYWFLTGMSVALQSSCQTMARKWWGIPLRMSSWGEMGQKNGEKGLETTEELHGGGETTETRGRVGT